MERLLILTCDEFEAWHRKSLTVPLPGGSLPYGAQLLSKDFLLEWSDAGRQTRVMNRLLRHGDGALRRFAPGVQGAANGIKSATRLRRTDAILTIFENAGLWLARLRSAPRPLVSTPLVMMTCWLAEDCLSYGARASRSVRRSIGGVSQFTAFSSNQIPTLERMLGVDPQRVSVVPYGIDVDFYSPASSVMPGGGGGILAVGSDSRRDYRTLLRAVEMHAIPLTLVCRPRNLVTLSIPPHVRVLTDVDHKAYRDLLKSADLVVTPTVAPEYPSGQSVVLEAMSMGKATLTTDSAAMRDYVTDGIDGFLVPGGDPLLLADRMTELIDQKPLLDDVGERAAQSARQKFSLEAMWAAVTEVIRGAMR